MPGERDEFVFTSTWYENLQELEDSALFNDAFWQKVKDIRDEANRAIEEARKNGVIGGTLEAEVEIYAQASDLETLKALDDELKFVLITSKVTLHDLDKAPLNAFASENGKLKFVVTKSKAHKCERCWHYEEGVGENAEHPGLCPRCLENIGPEGEKRRFA